MDPNDNWWLNDGHDANHAFVIPDDDDEDIFNWNNFFGENNQNINPEVVNQVVDELAEGNALSQEEEEQLVEAVEEELPVLYFAGQQMDQNIVHNNEEIIDQQPVLVQEAQVNDLQAGWPQWMIDHYNEPEPEVELDHDPHDVHYWLGHHHPDEDHPAHFGPDPPHIKHILCKSVRRLNYRLKKLGLNPIRESGGLYFKVYPVGKRGRLHKRIFRTLHFN